jgi:hypothetical protein
MTEASIDRSPSLRGSFFQDLLGTLVAVLIGLFAAAIPFITNPWFFFNDDEQNQHYPYFIDIGQHLHHHQWPGVTLSTLYGGNLIDDWQYELFNPFSLLTYWFISPMKNLLLVGLFLIGTYLILLSVGAYFLGRAFGLSRLFSLSIAACLVTNNFLQYMYCDSWSLGIISITWFIWTWVFLERYRTNGNSWALGALICSIYLTITSGWPHTILMLGLLMLGNIAQLIFVQRLWPRALALLLANLGVLLTTTPYLLPALLSFSWMTRPSGIHSTGLLMPDLGSVLNVSSIFFYPRIHLYNHEYAAYPMLFLAWFILPLLPLCSWPVVVETLQNRWGLLALACVSFIMLFGPESLGPIRYPIRFLPYLHLSLLIAFFLSISTPGIFRISKLRLAAVLVVLFFQFCTCISVRPETFNVQLVVSGVDVLLVLIAVRLIYFRNRYALGVLLVGSTMFIFWMTHVVSRVNGDLSNFGAAIQNNTVLPTVARPFSGYQLTIIPLVADNTKDVRLAAEGIFDGLYTINGYCALGHVGLRPGTFGFNWFEFRDTSGIDFLLAKEPTTNQPIVSLMRVNRLLIFNGYVDHARPLLGSDWIPASTGEYATVFENAAPNYAPTTLSYASDGIVAQPQGELTGEQEQLKITANATGGQLVFARLYWPGYEAQLNGNPVSVNPLDKIFVKVDLPPGSTGELTLKFVPPGWRLALVLAAIGGILCCAAVVINPKPAARCRS